MTDDRPKDELTGKVLGQFEIQEEIGRGGMASVYRGLQQSMGRTVAVKVLPRSLMHDPSFYERFEREVDVISRLEHPHILPIYDYGQSDGMPYIAMRYLGGGSLEQRLARSILDPDELETPLRQIAQALDHAHRQGIIHRDLKPGNIMLDEDGNAYLSDFGIARVLGSNLTGSMIVGTPAYMSPEQANGMPVDGRADIYSLGVMVFHLLTGKRPFQAETPMAVLLKHISEPMPSLAKYRADLSVAINDVVAKSTAKDPNNRYSSAIEMAEAFASARRGETTKIEKKTQAMPEVQPVTLAQKMDDNVANNVANNVGGTIAGNSAASSPDVSPTPSDISREAPTNIVQPEKQGLSVATMLFILAALVIIVGGIAVVVMGGQQGDDTVVVDAVPTPFPRSSTIVHDLYTVSMVNDWIPPQDFYDLSEGRLLRHVWREDDNSALVSLSIVDAELTGDNTFFQDAIEDYVAEYYPGRLDTLEFFAESVAEDGTLRRSYWVNTLDEAMMPERLANIGSGQLDVFFQQRVPYLVVVEMYTSDGTANTLVLRLQAILDSLRIKVADGEAS